MKKINMVLTSLLLFTITACSETTPSNVENSNSGPESILISDSVNNDSQQITTNNTSLSLDNISVNDSIVASISSISNSTKEDSYYSAINTTVTGATLRKQIYDLMIATHKTYTSYDGLSTAFKTTDADPNNPGNVLAYYTGISTPFSGNWVAAGSNLNREHVWPKSKGVGGSGPGADAQHLRPCDARVNTVRDNYGFGPGEYIPEDAYKGDAARIIFYVGAHYGPESTYGLQIVESVAGGSKSFGSLSVLLEWNLKFPVADSERRRNEAGQAIQGNRNPFIDHPEYACRIWGQTNENTKKACGY